jgi:3-methylfumaryl-CoA hydratase
MVFVTVRHRFECDGELAVVEEQDVVYRSQPAGSPRTTAPEPAEEPDAAPGDGQLRIDPDPRMLFRFSALTYNTHRIHYDQPYVTGVEGYPGLVVHGPLLALLLLELPRRHRPGRALERFSYRLTRPVFVGRPVVADHADPGTDDELHLAAGVPGAPSSVTGQVGLRPA